MSSKEGGVSRAREREIYKLSRLHRGPRGGGQATRKPGSLQMASLIMQGIENSRKMVETRDIRGFLHRGCGVLFGKTGGQDLTAVKTWDERIGGRCPLKGMQESDHVNVGSKIEKER